MPTATAGACARFLGRYRRTRTAFRFRGVGSAASLLWRLVVENRASHADIAGAGAAAGPTHVNDDAQRDEIQAAIRRMEMGNKSHASLQTPPGAAGGHGAAADAAAGGRLQVGMCCKHFAAYSLEKFNQSVTRHTFDARVSEQAAAPATCLGASTA